MTKNEIKEIEKKSKGIVNINLEDLDENPKRVKKKKHFFVENDILAEKSIGGDFDEKIPIQNIKTEEKTHYKSFISEISQAKPKETSKIEDLQKEIDNQKKLIELRIKQIQEEKTKLLKEEKAKKRAEKRERRRKHWYFRMFMRKEKPKEIKENYSNPNEIKLVESNDTILKICPICSAKIKKQKVNQENGIFRQLFKCKKCPFSKEIIIKI